MARSTLARLSRVKNRAPVSYSGSMSGLVQLFTPGGIESSLRTFGAVGTVFSIIDANASACGEVEWNLYRKSRSGKEDDRTLVPSHAALTVLNTPNPHFTWNETVEALIQHFDLVGEGWLVIGRNPLAPGIPLELWVVRPDRIAPVPDKDKFIAGYIYTGPNGEQVPLELNEVIRIRRPNPLDPYRGIGAVQSVMTDVDASKLTSEWNLNFFKNSAEPGGIIETEDTLDDNEFRKLTDRWREQHKGVAKAHRVAVLEGGARWVDVKYTNRDMQFVELRTANRETIREAFRFPVPMMGTTTDVNRANAEAAEVVFARWLVKPRLERIRSMLNNQFLPLFGAAASGLQFDFVSPVPDDRQADSNELTAKVNAAVALIGQGADPADTLDKLGLPEIDFAKPAPTPAPPPAPAPDPAQDELTNLLREYGPVFNRAPRQLWTPGIRAADQPELPDLGDVQREWESALATLLRNWGEVDQSWNTQLLDQILLAATSGDYDALTRLSVPYGDAADLLAAAMKALGAVAAAQVAEDAASQGVAVAAVAPTLAAVTPPADAVVAFLAVERAVSAGREAVRVMSGLGAADAVVTAVSDHLNSLTDAQAETHLGGALTRAQHIARYDTYRAAPTAAYYANEILDKATCKYCRQVDGKWLGNDLLKDVALSYPMGGYIHCLGRQRCRGMVSAIWRPEQTGDNS
jgi:HK97 family phage portal protein